MFDRRLVIALGLVALLLIVDAWLTYRNIAQLNRDVARVAHTHRVIDGLEDIVSTMKDAETGQRGYIITGEPSYLEPYHAAVSGIAGKLYDVKSLMFHDTVHMSRFTGLEDLIDAKLKELDHTIALRRKDFDAARQVVQSGEGKATMDAIRTLASEIEQDERELLQAREQQSSRSYRVAMTTNLITAFLGLGLVVAFILVLRQNLMERANAASDLHQQREWFRTTLAGIGDAVIATDTQGRVTFLNPVAQALTGWKADEALGTALETVFPIFNAETRLPADNPALRALRDGKVVGLANHTLLRTKQGAEVPIDDSAAPIHDDQGNLVGAVLVFRDVTERRRTELERERLQKDLVRRVEQLAEADRLKNEFLAMLAHELRNPLAPLRNALRAVRAQGGQSGEGVQELWAIMERQVEALVHLVDDLLDVSRLTRGKIQLRKAPVEVAAIVTRAVETSRPLIDARHHELHVSLPGEPMVVEADVTRLVQVVSNLLNNAAKYTPEGGRIELTAEREDREAVVRVRDNGMGIPKEMLSKVFDLFTQSERTLERAEGGLGIGLTLVRRLTEMHDGRVAAFSSGPGKGSEFVVRLPLLPAATPLASSDDLEPDAPRGQGTPAQAKRARRILVVDDNRDSADSLAMLLRLSGHEAHTVHDGHKALEAAEAHRPDIMLLDIGLPGLDGYAVAQQTRSKPELANTMLIAVTGYGAEEDRRKSELAGFDFHLVKPVDFAQLQSLLDMPARQPG
jgi:PAS domain S-box-containing protein